MDQSYQTNTNPYGGYQQPVYKAPGKWALETTFGSPLYLTATILFTLNVIFVIIQNASGGLLGVLGEIAYYAGLPYEFTDLFSASVLKAILGQIIPILVIIGMWLAWAGSRVSKAQAATGGFSMLRVLNIIEAVFTMIGLVVGIILMIAVMAGGNYLLYSLSSELDMGQGAFTGLMIFLLIVVLVIGILAFLYRLKLAGIYKAGKEVALQGRTLTAVSMLVIVFNFLILIRDFMSSFSGFTLQSALDSMGLYVGLPSNYTALSLLSGLTGAIGLLLETITFIKFRKNAASLSQGASYTGYQNTGYQNTVYPNNGYQNTGYQNTGYQNAGYQNQNTGYQNNGYQSAGYQNTNTQTGAYNTFRQPPYQAPYNQASYQQPTAQPGQQAPQQAPGQMQHTYQSYQQPYPTGTYQRPLQNSQPASVNMNPYSTGRIDPQTQWQQTAPQAPAAPQAPEAPQAPAAPESQAASQASPAAPQAPQTEAVPETPAEAASQTTEPKTTENPFDVK